MMYFKNSELPIFFIVLMILFVSCSSDSELASGKQLDQITLIDGLEQQVLISWGDPISDKHFFGYDNDFIAFLPEGKGEARLWVNHSDVNTLFISGYESNKELARHREQVKKELYQIGGSYIKIKNNWGDWEVVDDLSNARITGATQMYFNWPEGIANRKYANGTVAPSSGSVTPWGTILIAEDNYQRFYGEINRDDGSYEGSDLLWESFLSNSTLHYGWLVEVDPHSGYSEKHIATGRFSHGAATLVPLSDGRVVIYSTDRKIGGCIYKYVSNEPERIYPGTLYVANLKSGTWNTLDYSYPQLDTVFASETEMLINCREAAKIVGGTPLEIPSHIAIDPISGDVVVAVEGSKESSLPYGKLIKLSELDNKFESLRFTTRDWLLGNEDRWSNPYNLAFDQIGNLWFTTNIPVEQMGDEPYQNHVENGLFVHLQGAASQPVQVATAPREAAFSGLCFTPDGESLFLSVKHPGKLSHGGTYTSSWPGGNQSTPKPSVVILSGDFLTDILEK